MGPSPGAEEDDAGEAPQLRALTCVAPCVAGSWALAGLAAGTAWGRLSWELDAIAALSAQLALVPHARLAASLPASCAPALGLAAELLRASGAHLAAALQMLPGAATAAIAAALVAASERAMRARLQRVQRPTHSPLASAAAAVLMPALGGTAASAVLGIAYCGGGARAGRAGAAALCARGWVPGLPGLEAVSLWRAGLADWLRAAGAGRGGLAAWMAGASVLGGAMASVRAYRCLVRACQALSVLPSRVEYGSTSIELVWRCDALPWRHLDMLQVEYQPLCHAPPAPPPAFPLTPPRGMGASGGTPDGGAGGGKHARAGASSAPLGGRLALLSSRSLLARCCSALLALVGQMWGFAGQQGRGLGGGGARGDRAGGWGFGRGRDGGTSAWLAGVVYVHVHGDGEGSAWRSRHRRAAAAEGGVRGDGVDGEVRVTLRGMRPGMRYSVRVVGVSAEGVVGGASEAIYVETRCLFTELKC